MSQLLRLSMLRLRRLTHHILRHHAILGILCILRLSLHGGSLLWTLQQGSFRNLILQLPSLVLFKLPGIWVLLEDFLDLLHVGIEIGIVPFVGRLALIGSITLEWSLLVLLCLTCTESIRRCEWSMICNTTLTRFRPTAGVFNRRRVVLSFLFHISRVLFSPTKLRILFRFEELLSSRIFVMNGALPPILCLGFIQVVDRLGLSVSNWSSWSGIPSSTLSHLGLVHVVNRNV